MGVKPLLPYATDRETQGFFDAAAEDRLVYRACKDCDHALHPPTAHCPFCGGWNTDWKVASGKGTLHTWTTVTHQIHPGFPTPYTIVVVELDDTPEVRLMGHIDGAPALEAGMPMTVWFDHIQDGPTLPQWRPA